LFFEKTRAFFLKTDPGIWKNKLVF
jgi:hypothetical protein